MYSAYKLNKQGDNIQPWCTPFLIWNQSIVPCTVLAVASWPAYRFLKKQVRAGIPISFRIFQFIVIYTVKGFGIVNKAEIDIFLELSCFLMIQQMLAMWSLVPLPFLKPAWTSGSSWFTKPVNQKHVDCQTFLQQRWVHSGFAENYNLRSSTLQIPTRQREENAFTEKKRKLGVGERPWTEYMAFHWLNPVKNGRKGAFLFLIGLCSCDSVCEFPLLVFFIEISVC